MTRDLVALSLPRILERTRCELEVVVVNNDSEQADRIRDLVEGLGDERVRVLELEHGAGYCKAINAGIAVTTGQLVFFANSDLFVADGYVDTIARLFEAHPGAACATGKILRYNLAEDRETDVIDTTGLVIGRNRRVSDRGENQRDVGQFEREEEVFGVSGAALVARRRALEAVKVRGEYLDESFHMYKEDVDLSWRFRLAGWACWYVPTAIAYHARTSHGLADTPYLRGIRAFHENEKRKPREVRINSMKNQWLTLAKNDRLANVAIDLPYIAGREALVVGHNLLFSPQDTVTAFYRLARDLPSSFRKRRALKSSHTAPRRLIRRWLA